MCVCIWSFMEKGKKRRGKINYKLERIVSS